MFAILFGLSMDYEVFLLSRIREDYERTGDAHGSVARGLASTSRVITSAAAIMVLVFLGFVTEEGVVIKMIGFGMAVAIFLDATLVRMVLVPATMSLLGERNWWLPAWLDRILPTGQVEAPELVVRDRRRAGRRPSWSADASGGRVLRWLLWRPAGHTTQSASAHLSFRPCGSTCWGRRRSGWTAGRSSSGRSSPARSSPPWHSREAGAVSLDTLADLVWGESRPTASPAPCRPTSPGCAARSSPDRAPRTPPTVLVTVPPGYALRLADDAVDALRFAARSTAYAAGSADARTPGTPPALRSRTSSARCRASSTRRSALWRGERPTSSSGTRRPRVAERTRLDELRMVALEDRAGARPGAGSSTRRLPAELEALTAAYPLRERLWGLRPWRWRGRAGRPTPRGARQVRARARRGAGARARRAELQELQTAVLRQDPALESAHRLDGLPCAARATSAGPLGGRASAWPLVGRDAQLASLVGLLDAGDGSSTPAFAAVTGDPGIGKSRLCAELVAIAHDRGTCACVVGRCSQDDGAPPLWPWQQVLDDARRDAASTPARPTRARSSAPGRRSSGGPRRRAARQPLVVVLDDLHWADTASLRVLRLLRRDRSTTAGCCSSPPGATHPEPTGALADVAEALARRHAPGSS